MIKLTLAEQANILLDRIEKNLKAIVDAVKIRKHKRMMKKANRLIRSVNKQLDESYQKRLLK